MVPAGARDHHNITRASGCQGNLCANLKPVRGAVVCGRRRQADLLDPLARDAPTPRRGAVVRIEPCCGPENRLPDSCRRSRSRRLPQPVVFECVRVEVGAAIDRPGTACLRHGEPVTDQQAPRFKRLLASPPVKGSRVKTTRLQIRLNPPGKSFVCDIFTHDFLTFFHDLHPPSRTPRYMRRRRKRGTPASRKIQAKSLSA